MVRRLVVQDMDEDSEREYDDEVEDEEAYERFGSAFDRYGSTGASTAGLGVYGRYETRRVWDEFEGDG